MDRHRARLFLALLLSAETAGAGETSFIDLPLEDLGKLEVAAVSRKAQRLSDMPAAVTVLSAEDIRRSGARSIPEALREVPGVNVAQIGTTRWAVGVRGAQGRFANKLLVQVDGRSLYNPLFSGVFWEAQDVMIEDVERIEVVRGAGASLWGANAVNGVINIVTRKASATRGGLVSFGADSQGGVTTAVRQGVELEGVGAMRVFAKGRDLGRSDTVDGDRIGEVSANVVLGAQPLPSGSPFPAVVLRSQPAPTLRPRAERVDAAEFGYRRTLPSGSFEAVLFHHDYRRLITPTTDPAGFLPVPGFALPVQQVFRSYFSNARTTGLELAADMTLTATVRLQGSYTVLDTQARRYSDPLADAAGMAVEDAAPHHWASLHALWSPGGGHELDLMLRRVGAVGGSVPAYTSFDARYGWHLGRAFDLAVVGQNLFDRRHLEYASDFFVSQLSYQPRRAYIQGLWRF